MRKCFRDKHFRIALRLNEYHGEQARRTPRVSLGLADGTTWYSGLTLAVKRGIIVLCTRGGGTGYQTTVQTKATQMLIGVVLFSKTRTLVCWLQTKGCHGRWRARRRTGSLEGLVDATYVGWFAGFWWVSWGLVCGRGW